MPYPFGVSQIARGASSDWLLGTPLFDGTISYQAVSAFVPEPQPE